MKGVDTFILMEDAHRPLQQCPPWRRPRWRNTLLAQALLLFALYGALNIGSIQMRGTDGDLYFISVEGGSRPPDQQMRLLLQMENAVRTFKVKFIVNLNAMGKNDPLLQNATLYSPNLRVPWYTTSPSSQRGNNYFIRKIKLPHGSTLDLILLDTRLWQASGEGRLKQLRRLTETLATTNSIWRVVFGSNPPDSVCEDKDFDEQLYRILSQYKVKFYLSSRGCGANHGGHGSGREIGDGFYLHGVNPLRIESCFIGSTEKVISKSTVNQWGREDS